MDDNNKKYYTDYEPNFIMKDVPVPENDAQETNDDINFIVSGEGIAICDDFEEILKADVEGDINTVYSELIELKNKSSFEELKATFQEQILKQPQQ